MTMITLDHISFVYGSSHVAALDGVSLRVGPGERVCIMGANGSGKSTLARLIAGLSKPTGGTLSIEPSEPASIGILFQNPDNQMVASVVENEIAFALENMAVPMTEMEARVTETLRRFGIEHLRRRLTTELSGGEKQRVALASIMITDPRILILDEPDSFLDEAGKRLLDEELRRLHEQLPELIEIRITQYPSVAKNYPRLLVFSAGKLVADTEPVRVFADERFCSSVGLRYEPDGIQNRFGLPARSRTGQPSNIELKDVRFGYAPGAQIISELSLVLTAGETVGFVGPSGSGKTSLGLLLCGLLTPNSGTILYFDHENHLLGFTAKPGWIAGAFQQPERQFFLSSSREEIAFGPKNFGVKLSNDEVSKYLHLVGLEPNEFMERDPFTLSMGEKRRLAFAVILAVGPSFIVFDEPTCALDPEGVGRFLELSSVLKNHSVGQVIITHDGNVIDALCDRVLYLDGSGGAELLAARRFLSSSRYAGVVSPSM